MSLRSTSIAPLALSVALLAAAALPAARAAESYDGCAGFIDSLPATIATQGVWCLRKDLSTAMASGNAITIANNNITIDCNDFKLGGLAAGNASTARGIHAEYRQNLTVRNCAIRGFHTGIDLLGGGVHLVEDNRLDLNLAAGIRLASIGGALLRRNRVSETGGYPDNGERFGIHCNAGGGGSCDLRDNLVSGVLGTGGHFNTVTGLRLVGGTGSRIAGNQVAGLAPTGGNAARGIYASNHGPTYLSGNTVMLSVAAAGSLGIRCGAGAGAMRDNGEWGFETAFSCHDDGGNVDH